MACPREPRRASKSRSPSAGARQTTRGQSRPMGRGLVCVSVSVSADHHPWSTALGRDESNERGPHHSPAISAGLPSSTSSAWYTLSRACAGLHTRRLRPSDGAVRPEDQLRLGESGTSAVSASVAHTSFPTADAPSILGMQTALVFAPCTGVPHCTIASHPIIWL